jgi:hypothetical protein
MMTPEALKRCWKELIEDYPLSFLLWVLHDGVRRSTLSNVLSSCLQKEHTSFETLLAMALGRKEDREERLNDLIKSQPPLEFKEFEELLAVLMNLSGVQDWHDVLNSRGKKLVDMLWIYAELDLHQRDQILVHLTDGLYRGELNLALLLFYICDRNVSSDRLWGPDENGDTYLDCLNDPDAEWSMDVIDFVSNALHEAVRKKSELETIEQEEADAKATAATGGGGGEGQPGQGPCASSPASLSLDNFEKLMADLISQLDKYFFQGVKDWQDLIKQQPLPEEETKVLLSLWKDYCKLQDHELTDMLSHLFNDLVKGSLNLPLLAFMLGDPRVTYMMLRRAKVSNTTCLEALDDGIIMLSEEVVSRIKKAYLLSMDTKLSVEMAKGIHLGY